MSKWLPATDCLLDLMANNLPSSRDAQKYRTLYLCEGPQEDLAAEAMRKFIHKGHSFHLHLKDSSIN
jgi:elongation factor 2